MRRVLGSDFFDRSALVVAKDLIGKFLVRKINGKEVALMIVETEAYLGPKDLASHARFGKTLRTAPMFGPAGTIYIYFTYGIHWMLNISCGPEDFASAVLIRGIEGYRGPAKLTKFLKIDGSLTNKQLGKKSGLWVEDRGVKIKSSEIKRTPRVGIDYAGEFKLKPWRFILDSETARAVSQAQQRARRARALRASARSRS